MTATDLADLDTCPHCEGAGAYWDDQTGQPDEPYGGRMVECHVCEGEGIVDTSPCIGCGAPVYDHDEGCPVDAAKDQAEQAARLTRDTREEVRA